MIPYLNNEPGVKSKRWLGHEASDEELINHTISHLRGVILAKRKARLETCLCFYDPQTKKTVYQTGKILGHISSVPTEKRVAGFPYRALFIVDRYNKYYDELTEDEHREVNHRLIALKRLTKRIKDLIR